MGDRNTGISRDQLRDYTLKRQDLSPDGLVWQEPVIDKDLTTPPGSPSIDDRYLIISGGSGTDWAGHDNDIVHYHSGQWSYYTPIEGWFIWINDENKLYRFDGSSWAEFAGAGGGDMYKSTYDIDEDGIVDNSEKLEGSTKTQVQDHTPKAHTHVELDITNLDKYTQTEVDNKTAIDNFTIKKTC